MNTEAMKSILEKIISSPEFSAAIGAMPETAKIEKRYFTVPEAEKYAGLKRWTLWRFSWRGKLPIIKLDKARSGKILYDKADIDKLLKSLKSNCKS